MKIFVTGVTGESLPPPYAGIPKHSLLLARAWREAGAEVVVTFTYERPDPDDLGADATYYFEYTRSPDKLAKLGFLLRFGSRKPLLYLGLLRAAWKAERRLSREIVLYAAYGVFLDVLFAKERPDVVLSETALIKTFMAAEVCERRGIPLVIHTYAEVHDLTMSPNKTLQKTPGLVDAYWSGFLSKAAAILAPSWYCAKAPAKYVAKDRMHMVYFGIDIQPYLSSTTTQADARAHFRLPADGFYAIAVGAFSPRKGHDHLIKAAGILAKVGKPMSVLLCGPGDQDKLKQLAIEEGVGDRVFFFSGLSEAELVMLYRAADVYCDASNTVRACLGMSLTEGMAAGLPSVSYDAGGMPEVVLDQDNGFVVPTNEIHLLSEALDKVRMLPPEDRARMGERGREIARSTVDIANEGRDVLALLTKVAQEHHTRI
jgi:glycosyltransferase involved in cell wall biosynthesis